ncbi:hypothetical protein GNE08_18735 [Trichormus variabilis ARAD]|nr:MULTISPECIES: hypothetical protein [Nostocaceae]MBC1216258.1 hypothetical protein [Trichormus variabilis ARAD]MBC1258211.1 hypothetical protein [Trichormus variabilis V5]MBC1268325.1 hypothetical protein [Trichormus variabilis FSR]MBC1304714.1 hypothetical protein [Trichormus variabilis N2B]MBC1313420.1 hypothetical protein [Trichormus variabilis PNB]
MESLIYLVFKVRLRELVTKVAVERSLCQEVVPKKYVEISDCKRFGDCVNLIASQNHFKPIGDKLFQQKIS